MAGVIICTGRYAKIPFICDGDGIKIYSAEELCYYLHENAENITFDFFSDRLINFIKDELELDELHIVLKRLIAEREKVKVLISAVLSVSDYYTSEEITDICRQLEQLESLNSSQKLKRHADYLLKCKMYKAARSEYLAAVSDDGASKLDGQEYGEVLHNLAVLDIMAGDINAAAVKFREAFERNKNIESLKQYLYAVKQGGGASVYESEAGYYLEYKGLYEQIEEGLKKAENDFNESSIKSEIERITALEASGKTVQAAQLFNGIMQEIKGDYRKECL